MARGRKPRTVGNRSLRAARLERRWTEEDTACGLQALAAELDEPEPPVDRIQVAKWELGIRMPGPFYQARLCLLYEATPELLGFASRPTLLRTIGELALKRLEKRETDSKRDESVGGNPIRRAGQPLSAAAFPSMDRERLATTLRYLWPVDRPLMAGLQHALKELMRRGDAEAPTIVLPDMIEYRNALLVLLSRSQPPDLTPTMQKLASEASCHIGWLTDHDTAWAQSYANFALAESLAREAESGTQVARVLVGRSAVYSRRAATQDQLRPAIELTEASALSVGPDALAGLRGWILGERAILAAETGDEVTAGRYLDQAYGLAATAPGEMNIFSDYDSAWLDGYRADVARKLRRDEAIAIYELVLQNTDPRLTWERVSALTHLAEISAAKAEIERACRLLQESIELALLTGDGRGVTAALRVRSRLLSPYRGHSTVRNLDELIRITKTQLK